MALADSVPGVSGGTIAFLLGFYDSFINSLNDIMGRDNAKRKKAFFFLIKLGVGWVIGMLLAVDAADADKTVALAEQAGEKAYIIGEITEGEKGISLLS